MSIILKNYVFPFASFKQLNPISQHQSLLPKPHQKPPENLVLDAISLTHLKYSLYLVSSKSIILKSYVFPFAFFKQLNPIPQHQSLLPKPHQKPPENLVLDAISLTHL